MAERLDRFVLARLIVDAPDPAAHSKEWARLLLEDFGTEGIPLYAAFTPDGKVLGSTTFPGGSTESYARTMAAFLDEMLVKPAK